MTTARKITGVEAQRVRMRAEAIRGIQSILDLPQGRPKDVRKDWLAPPPVQSFRRIELHLEQDNDDFWLFHPDDCTPQVLWPLNVAFGFVTPGEEATIMQMRTIRPKEARGYAEKFGPYMVRNDGAQMFDGKLQTFAGLSVWLGGQWMHAGRTKRWEGTTAKNAVPYQHGATPQQDREQPSLAIGIALRQRYEWAVALGFENTPTIRFATDPTGIKEVFKLRELPSGRDRRDALLTWVSDHWRQDRRDDDVERYVRKHVRGATEFEWNGMYGELLPSAFDMEEVERLKSERQAMREAGTDIRAKAVKP